MNESFFLLQAVDIIKTFEREVISVQVTTTLITFFV